MNPKNIAIRDFTYMLPDERIARYPLQQRDAAKLLVYKSGEITEDVYSKIAGHLPAGTLLIFNNTKVIEARLLFQKPTGGVIEIFCLEPAAHYPDVTTAMQQQKMVQWQCLIGGASKWKAGQVLQKHILYNGKELLLEARFIAKQTDVFLIQLSWTPEELSFAEVLHLAGAIPLPPYLKRAVEKEDAERYQTVYAQYDGSVAAPTAGLHFTENIFQQLETKKIDHDFVTLHVGAGTFKPVSAETLEQHEMHQEFIQVSLPTIEHLYNACDQVIAVGTTSLRTLETLYWLGVKAMNDPAVPAADMHLSQWEAYEMKEQNISAKLALHSLMDWMKRNRLTTLFSHTQMIITPGYDIKMAKALITNFHQPQSTLLLLVAAMAGNDWKKIYGYALEHNFRFLSYGDGSLIWKK